LSLNTNQLVAALDGYDTLITSRLIDLEHVLGNASSQLIPSISRALNLLDTPKNDTYEESISNATLSSKIVLFVTTMSKRSTDSCPSYHNCLSLFSTPLYEMLWKVYSLLLMKR
jgi:hypothetical protein